MLSFGTGEPRGPKTLRRRRSVTKSLLKRDKDRAEGTLRVFPLTNQPKSPAEYVGTLSPRGELRAPSLGPSLMFYITELPAAAVKLPSPLPFAHWHSPTSTFPDIPFGQAAASLGFDADESAAGGGHALTLALDGTVLPAAHICGGSGTDKRPQRK